MGFHSRGRNLAYRRHRLRFGYSRILRGRHGLTETAAVATNVAQHADSSTSTAQAAESVAIADPAASTLPPPGTPVSPTTTTAVFGPHFHPDSPTNSHNYRHCTTCG